MKRLLYLYREIMPYNIPVLREIVALGFDIKVVYKATDKKTPYIPPQIKGIEFLDEKDFKKDSLIELGLEFNPDLVFICDWSIKKYNQCGRYLRKELNIPVIVGCDTQWVGGKQWANVFTSQLRHHRYFSHILVAGVRQFEYAKKLGFKNEQILFNLYSADLENFRESKINESKFNGNRNFLFVGRFVERKGIRLLKEAWDNIDNKENSTLTLIGNGPLENEFHSSNGLKIYPFMSQKELLKFAEQSSCFILPSIFEPWALVIQEFAASGLPLIVTSACGATPHFVVNNYNGIVIKPGSVKELQKAIERMMHANTDELLLYAKRSKKMSENINPELVARSLTSVL